MFTTLRQPMLNRFNLRLKRAKRSPLIQRRELSLVGYIMIQFHRHKLHLSSGINSTSRNDSVVSEGYEACTNTRIGPIRQLKRF